MTKLHSRRIKGDRTGFGGHLVDLALGDEQKLRVRIHKAFDEPGARDPVNVNV
jgi:hypothetical protein